MKTNLKRYFFPLLLVMATLSTSVRAQQLQASLSHYSTDDGLASNAISHIVHDDYGYVWIATWNGLSRFDGYHFYNYQTGNASRIPHLHNRIMDLAIDQPQNVWMRMYDGRIFVLNRLSDRIEDPMVGISGHDEYRTSHPITVTTGGDVLVSFDEIGIYKFHLDRNGVKQQHIMTGGLKASAIVEGYQNDLWVGTDKGVHRIDLSNLALERKGYFLDENITAMYSNGYNIYVGTASGKLMQFSYGQDPKIIKEVGQEISALYVDSHGVLWYSDLSMGVYRINLTTGDTKHFMQKVLVPEFTGNGAEFNESIGVVWVRMNHGGYGYYNREADEFEYFHNDPSNPWNLSNTVNARLELNEGVLWQSTSRRGLEKLELLKNTITRSLLIPGAESSLDNEVRAMYYDKERRLLFLGNKNNSLFIFDQHQNKKVISHDDTGHPIGRLYGMTKDSKGNYWLCSKDYGLFKMVPKGADSYSLTNICHRPKDNTSLSSNSAYEAVEDREGNIWVATYGGGVNILKKDKNNHYVALHYKNALKRYPLNSFLKVRTIEMDHEGNVWAGTTDGILIMSLHNNRISIKRLDPPQEMEKGLLSNDIVCLRRDHDGNMWVGTNGGGLSCTDQKDVNGTWTFHNYSAKDGLPSEEIRSITFDSSNNVWFATDHIICSFDVKKQIFTTFSSLDGVDDTMCSEGAAIAVGSDKILIGTINGYYTVDRKKLTTSTGSLLKLKITDFFINDEPQSPRLNDLYDYYVPESKQVALPSHGSVFSFQFAALNYQLQHRVHYQYMLDGYDNDWKNAEKNRKVSYSGVPAGTYRFKVKAFLLESPENYDMRTIDVIVPPYFMLSTTAVWCYLIIIAVLLIALLFWYQRRIRLKLESADIKEEHHVQEEEMTSDLRQEQSMTTDEYEIIEE